jgi:hypothetical protein
MEINLREYSQRTQPLLQPFSSICIATLKKKKSQIPVPSPFYGHGLPGFSVDNACLHVSRYVQCTNFFDVEIFIWGTH